jgi:hypothetical protein
MAAVVRYDKETPGDAYERCGEGGEEREAKKTQRSREVARQRKTAGDQALGPSQQDETTIVT